MQISVRLAAGLLISGDCRDRSDHDGSSPAHRLARRAHRHGSFAARHLDGPAALRTAGLAPLLESLDFEVVDYGDLSVAEVEDLADRPPEKANHYREIQRWTRLLSRRGHEIAQTGALPIFLGGDHTLSMGSVNAMARHWQERGRELFVLWLDAHADYNTPETTITANMHGMSAAFLCGEPGLDGLLGDDPRASIDPDRLDLFGARSIDKLERELMRTRRIRVVDMRQIDEFGVAVLIRRVIERVKACDGVLHVSFDVDFLDPCVAPGSAPRCRAERPIARRI